jgi:hypothetical protein
LTAANTESGNLGEDAHHTLKDQGVDILVCLLELCFVLNLSTLSLLLVGEQARATGAWESTTSNVHGHTTIHT